ncbi:hypothetical protein HYE67_006889 [Fusarium culmorum]|uniref:Uncharacterized protein n=1 Tax=Fusarium culmorum TaxID=5516 RepID=A0A7S8HX84_FUSCU|nr:hypothetical protein HYE67_006889 [Fusarium culmorum]
MATVGVSASASGPGPGPVDFDDSSSVASDLSTLDFQGDFHTDLIDIILDIKPPGNISVNEVGKVALPLGESQARQAPFGKGADTFVDTSVRNTWELDPSQFTIGSVEWPAYLQIICRTAAQQMAPSAALRRFASQPLRHCIRRWLAQDQDSRQSPYVYHILEHEYTEANISYKTLKGPDMTRVAAIRQACNGLPVAIFLALVEKMESGSVAFAPYDLQYGDDSDTSYHHIDDVLESDLSVKITKDLDGNVL